MQESKKTNWAHIGYFAIAIASSVFIFDFIYDQPGYTNLERINGVIEKHRIVRTPQGVGTHWIYIRSGTQTLVLCMPQMPNLLDAMKAGMDIWALAEPSSPCDYQIWEIGSEDKILISYNSFVARENVLANKLLKFAWLFIAIGSVLIIYSRIKSNEPINAD